jgi:hypothetical protein
VFGCLRPSDRFYRPAAWRRAIAMATFAITQFRLSVPRTGRMDLRRESSLR